VNLTKRPAPLLKPPEHLQAALAQPQPQAGQA
jgi:hypothetical protein